MPNEFSIPRLPPKASVEDDDSLIVDISAINLRRLESLQKSPDFQFKTMDDVIGWLLRMARQHSPSARWWLDLDDLHQID